MVEVIYRSDRNPAQRIRDELGNQPSEGITAQTRVTVPSTRTVATVYEQGYQSYPPRIKPSLLNE